MKYERWENIPDYKNYQVSSSGNVRRLTNYIKCKDGKLKLQKGRVLKIGADGNGYRTARLSSNGNLKSFRVSVLVAAAFLGHKPNKGIVVDHINNIKTDDRLANLQIITNRENLSKDKKGGLSKYVGVSYHKSSKKWTAKIYHNGKSKYLGLFKYELEASTHYQNALMNYNQN